ncbi:MAG: signal peptide peptidase SppA [Victivallaceae bacterium]|nr:signal peptide peptidase SppA [Victivallaceae bacterium]
MEQEIGNNVQPQLEKVIVEKPKKSHGCLWALVGFGAFSFIAFGAAAILGVIIANGISSIRETSGDQFESYERQFISGDKSSLNTILVIPVNGLISADEDTSPFAAACMASATKICQHLAMAEEDKSVKAVIMRIDSPGGEVVASDQIHHAILQIRKAGKPVVAVIGSLGASGAYYLACACDKIIAHRLSITGSIGVIIQNYKYYELLKKIGVKSDTYTSCRYKDLLDGSRPEKPGERAIIQSQIDQVYEAFIQIVAAGRPGLSPKQLRNSILTDGRIFLGSDALKLKLIDQVGFFADGIETAARLAHLENYSVIAYKKKFSLAALFNAGTRAPPAGINVNLPGRDKTVIQAGKFYYLPIQ